MPTPHAAQLDRRDGDIRSAPRSEPAAARRVRVAQGAARDGLTVAGVFVAGALVALAVPSRTGQWLPLHLFLAGGVVSAISGATVLFSVTWPAGAAPSRATTRCQQALVATGATGVAVARSLDLLGIWIAVPAAAFPAIASLSADHEVPLGLLGEPRRTVDGDDVASARALLTRPHALLDAHATTEELGRVHRSRDADVDAAYVQAFGTPSTRSTRRRPS